MKVFIAISALVAVTSAFPSHPAPAYAPAHPAAYKEPAYDAPAAYQYQYGVEDSYSGVNFGQNEARDGYATTGEYRVALPDGRTQIVSYNTADGYSGNVMDVRYEGEAHYDEYKPKAAYKPTPKYAPAPAPAYHVVKRSAPAYKEPAYDVPAAYQYQYGVEDSYSGVNFGQNEARDGYATNGEYRVALPDGRTQIVTYSTVDGYSGNVMDVRYEGEAQYPKYEPKAAYKPAPKYAPAYKPAPAYHAIAKRSAPAAYKKPAYDAPAAYQYQYGVEDSYSGVNFGQNEARDGYATNGEYRVALPDGRTQIVTYSTVDGYSGNVMDVRYEGEAQYPKYEPKAAYKPAPKYAPAPAYHA